MIKAIQALINKFKGETQSADTAASRMKLMLAHDRQGVSQGTLEKMKIEILEVISKYFDIDPQQVEFNIQADHLGTDSSFSTTVPLVNGLKIKN